MLTFEWRFSLMSQRNDSQGQPNEEPELDILTGEDVILDDNEFSDAATVVGGGPADEAPPAEPPTQEIDPAPLATDFPETSRVDISTAEDLAETTSVLATDFTAPRREDITEAMQDVLSGRAPQPTVAEDGETLVFSEVTETEDVSEGGEDLATTSVLRRSLINGKTAGAADGPGAFASTSVLETELVSEPTETAGEPSTPDEAPERSFDEALLAGASILPTLPSRAGARWLSGVGTLILAPLAWYLLTDSAVRLVAAVDNPWLTGQPNLAALAELAGGLAVLVVIAILATKSSLGLILSGITTLVAGLPFLAAPALVQDYLTGYLAGPLTRLGPVGDNLFFHLEFTGASGILVMIGAGMLIAAWVVYRVRRVGRREEALRAEVASVNPAGLNARWARKASE